MNEKNNIATKKRSGIAQVNDFSKCLGMSKKDLTVFKMLPNEDKISFNLELRNTKLNRVEPWFVIDEDDGAHALISLHTLNNLLETIGKNQKEIFELKLEKAIYQQMPVDFNDAWTVAIDAIEKNSQRTGVSELNIDLDSLMDEIKKEHPNLFIDVNTMMESLQNERL